MKDTESAFSPEKKESIEKLKPRDIIACIPGAGKTTFAEEHQNDISVVDLDSNPYMYDLNQPAIKDPNNRRPKNPDWPNNYFDAIEKAVREKDLVLIGSDPNIVKELTARGHTVTVVCADESLKDEFRKIYTDRKNDSATVDFFMEKAHASNEEQLEKFEGAKVVFLQSGQHLEHIIDLSGIDYEKDPLDPT